MSDVTPQTTPETLPNPSTDRSPIPVRAETPSSEAGLETSLDGTEGPNSGYQCGGSAEAGPEPRRRETRLGAVRSASSVARG